MNEEEQPSTLNEVITMKTYKYRPMAMSSTIDIVHTFISNSKYAEWLDF